jgi:hypothetical protein
MNYCSLEDAWGDCNQISNQYSNYMVEKNYKQPQQQSANDNKNIKSNLDFTFETFNNTPSNTISSQNNNKTIQNKSLSKNDDYHLDELYDCDSFINHIYNCRKCNNRVRNYFRPKLIENFQDIIEDNRDTIVLILIGISILLFFNLINNMTKSN